MIKLYNFDELKPEEILNRDIRAEKNVEDVVDSINDVTRQTTMIFVIMMITIVILTFLLSGWLTKPIVELTAAIRRMGTQGYGGR